MNELIAMAIVHMLIAAGAPKSEVHLACHKETINVVRKDKKHKVQVKACQVYVSRDGACQAVYDHNQGFRIWCRPTGKDVLVDKL